MKRYMLSKRDRFVNEGDSYQPIPCARIPVVPGQTHATTVRLKFQTAAFTRNLLTSGIASAHFFYVPNRLVWDEWVDFISQDDATAPTLPTTGTNWNLVWDRNPGAWSNSLYRRAYKLVYNQFYGDEDFDGGAPNTWYDDITTDTNVDQVICRSSEQWSGRLMLNGDMAVPTFDATTTPIDLNDFYRQMMNARSARKAQMTGDKYVDTLRRMGVEPDWRIQNAPEFLGRKDIDVHPVKTFNTTATGTGDSVARYEGTIEFDIGKKMFAEHGYIVGIFIIRPHLFNTQADVPPDGLARLREDFYLGDNLRSQDTYDEARFTSGSAADFISQRFAYLRNGFHHLGLGDGSWATTYAVGAEQNLVYPQGGTLPIGDELGTAEVAIAADVHSKGQTPVPKNAL